MNELASIEEQFPFLNIAILKDRLKWSVRLRWLAIVGYLAASYIAVEWTQLKICYRMVWALLAGLGAINLLYYLILKRWSDFSFHTEVWLLRIHILVDLVFLTFILHYSGGVENPAFIFFIFHVILSSILFGRITSLLFSVLVIIFFGSMVLLEAAGLLKHYTLFDPTSYNNYESAFLIVATFSITILVTNYICTGFMNIYRESKRIIDRQNKQLIELDTQKTKFFQFASHELKSPVIAIKSTLDVLLKGYSEKLENKTIDLLARAEKRSGQMLEMLTELLELVHLRNTKNNQAETGVDAHLKIKEFMAQFFDLAEKRKIKLITQLESQRSALAMIEDDFDKILSNLISNGIRYNREGGSLTVFTKNVNDSIQIRVTDTGIGIAEEDQEKVFEEFYRSKEAKKTVPFGTGLGLSLVKQIVEKNGGSISVHSEINKGTEFEIDLPGTGV